MIVIGLTGGIGMGKSAAAAILGDLGLSVHDADAAVHKLLAKGGKGVRPVARLFPQAFRAGAVDRRVLGAMVLGKPAQLKKLEKILHPLVRQAEEEFLRRARRRKAPAAVLDIPLLFETGAERRCDVTICVTAPEKIRQARTLRRKGMTRKKLAAIRAHQMPDAEKRRRADHVVDTGGTRAATRRQLAEIVKGLGAGI
ncbi:MAG TPA: dephospho-CoA kinase [Alphaproteobacteria bacterium]|jgi:dephospho-CoA kinase|nr:dephospho-CoA kinase [Alphaproteobacteria bacterium]